MDMRDGTVNPLEIWKLKNTTLIETKTPLNSLCAVIGKGL
jgi:hypothetical protein